MIRHRMGYPRRFRSSGWCCLDDTQGWDVIEICHCVVLGLDQGRFFGLFEEAFVTTRCFIIFADMDIQALFLRSLPQRASWSEAYMIHRKRSTPRTCVGLALACHRGL